MISFNCDDCGKQTFFNQIPEPVLDENGNQIPVSYFNQNPITGKMEKISTCEMAYPLEPAQIVRLSIGSVQTVQKDFCTECFSKHKDQIMNLFMQLGKVGL